MTKPTPRPAQPRRWTGLTLATTVTLAASSALAQGVVLAPHVTLTVPLPLVKVQAEGGEAGESGETAKPAEGGEAGEAGAAPATGGEGGEGGEAGATQGAAPDAAYLAQLSIVEGHMVAAVKLYEKGLADDAVALSYHPEAEMMDKVRDSLKDHGAADITPAMTALSEAMEAAAPLDQVQAKLAEVQAAIAAGQAVEADEVKTRFDALLILVKAAAAEYEGAIQDGKVEEAMAWHEAWAFLAVAKDLTADLAALPDEKAQKAAAKIAEALAGTDAAFGDIGAADLLAADPGILSAAAGRVELAASQVR